MPVRLLEPLLLVALGLMLPLIGVWSGDGKTEGSAGGDGGLRGAAGRL